MANLPIKSRRMLARGFNKRHVALLSGRKFLGIGNRATLTTALSGANNDVTLLAKTPGTDSNDVTLTIVEAGADTDLSVEVDGTDITVNVATDGDEDSTSTAKEVIGALNFNADASALVWAQDAPGSDGTGVVTALSSTSLSGAV